MKIKHLLIILSLSLLSQAPAFAANEDCDRSCLQSMMESYLNAVISNNIDAAPITVGFRQTENAVVKRLGTGTWETVTGIEDERRYYLDPVNGQAAFFGVVHEGAVPAITIVRLKVMDQEIVEAEWYLGRPGADSMAGPALTTRANLYDPAYFLANPPPAERNIATRDRHSRQSLTGVSDSYFDGITTHDGSIIQSTLDCFRVENGFLTAGRPLEDGNTDGYNGKSNCASGMGTFNISLVSNRRFLVIDEEQQTTVTSAVFLRNVDGFQRRCVFFEIFYVNDAGLIDEIYSVIYYPDPNLPVPNWAPYNGNFPLPESFGAAI